MSPNESCSISGVLHATPSRPQSKALAIAGAQPQRDAIPLLRFAVGFVAGFVNWVALQDRIDEQSQELGFRLATTRRQRGELPFPLGRGPGGDLLANGSARIHVVYKYSCVIFV